MLAHGRLEAGLRRRKSIWVRLVSKLHVLFIALRSSQTTQQQPVTRFTSPYQNLGCHLSFMAEWKLAIYLTILCLFFDRNSQKPFLSAIPCPSTPLPVTDNHTGTPWCQWQGLYVFRLSSKKSILRNKYHSPCSRSFFIEWFRAEIGTLMSFVTSLSNYYGVHILVSPPAHEWPRWEWSQVCKDQEFLLACQYAHSNVRSVLLFSPHMRIQYISDSGSPSIASGQVKSFLYPLKSARRTFPTLFEPGSRPLA